MTSSRCLGPLSPDSSQHPFVCMPSNFKLCPGLPRPSRLHEATCQPASESDAPQYHLAAAMQADPMH